LSQNVRVDTLHKGDIDDDIIIINIIIIIILGISFMQGIYSYIPETSHVPREYCIATILLVIVIIIIIIIISSSNTREDHA
jgi:protein-S-isoprenylcysteine O-methyltransferase Ste14